MAFTSIESPAFVNRSSGNCWRLQPSRFIEFYDSPTLMMIPMDVTVIDTAANLL